MCSSQRSVCCPVGIVFGERRRVRAWALASLAIVAVNLSGCAHVAPYERGELSRPGMDVQQREALRGSFYKHVYDSREGAMATSEHAGGGCGCN
jgi:hypothetical protein